MTGRFIHRPVLSIVISIIITMLGVLALVQLPMTLFPNVAPPAVLVEVEYPGANAETVTKAAMIPLERAINGAPGMKYMSTDAGNDGVGTLMVFFEVGTNPELAAVNVQTRIMDVMGELPSEVVRNGVKIAKQQNDLLMYVNVYGTDSTQDEKFVHNFADLNVLPELKRIKGVGAAEIMGTKEYAMRIWLKPDKMLAYNISAEEVLDILQEQNIEAAPGKVGESTERRAQELQYTMRYTGKFNTPEQYENIPIKANEDGEILHLKDIADVDLGCTYYDVRARVNGHPSAALTLKQLPGSNASEVIKNVKAELADLKEKMFLPGMDYEISYDVSRFLDASVHEVFRTLIEAFLLVSLVVYIFLQNWRTTLIPAIAVPVSLVGTFFFMQFMGFTLNLITLFALVLAIGIVVDNAIVVVEAVHAKMEHAHIGPRKATEQAMREISGAIIAITLVMAAVFLPVAFMGGPSGIFYRQFSITMAIAIVLSGVVALTLTPALCAVLLRHEHGQKKRHLLSRPFDAFNKWYSGVEFKYKALLGRIVDRRLVTWGALLLFLFATGGMSRLVPSGFIPNEDQGAFYCVVTAPPGATIERTENVVKGIEAIARKMPEVESVSTLAGSNILSDGTGATYGTCLFNLKAWDDRKRTAEEVMHDIEEKSSATLKDADIEFFPPAAVPGYGTASGFEARLLDKTGTGDWHKMQEVTEQFVKDVRADPRIDNAFTIFNAKYPQYMLHMDMDRAAKLGVTVKDAMSTLQTLLGSEYASNFVRFNHFYRVMVQALPEYRAHPDDVLKLYIKNDKGEEVPLSSFVTMEKYYGVDQVTRHNMYPAAELNGNGKAGVSSGTVLDIVKQTAKEKLPRGYDIDWAGITRDQANLGNEAIIIFLVCLAFVFLVLSAQYESFLLPLPVILSLPAGIFGAFAFLAALGLENNLYAQVAMIMLIGLLGKNAILIVEFATQRHHGGKSPVQAAIEGAGVRLRPILMTSFAFVAGLIPLMLASSAGAIGNRTIGSAAAGGMLFGTVFGVVLVPGLYVVFATLAEKLKIRRSKEEKPFTETL